MESIEKMEVREQAGRRRPLAWFQKSTLENA